MKGPTKHFGRWLIASIGLFGLWGCRSNKPSPNTLEIVSPLAWTEAGSRFLERLRLPQHKLERSFRGQLQRETQISWTKQKKPQQGRYAAILSLHLRFAHDIGGGVSEDPKSRMYLIMEMDLIPSTPKDRRLHFREERSALYDSSTPPPLGKIRAWTRELVEMGARSLRSFLALRARPNVELLTLLQKGSPLQQRQSSVLLSLRGDQRAIPLLLKKLNAQEDPKTLAIVGALVRLKAREAVIPLMKLAPRASSVFLQQLVSALAELGGWRAEGFLAMLSSAHQNRLIRQSAREALEEMRQKQLHAKAPHVAISPLHRDRRDREHR